MLKSSSRYIRGILGLFAAMSVTSLVVMTSQAPLSAQAVSTAKLIGLVSDPSGAFVPSAKVILDSTQQKYTRETMTDAEGRYSFAAIPPGQYKLSVTAPGFRPEEVSSFNLSSGGAPSINVALTVGAITDKVTITSAPPLLETATSTIGTVIGSKFVTELPLINRSFGALQLILPGVSPENDFSGAGWHNVTGTMIQPSFYGQRQRDNNYTLDGTPNTTNLLNGIASFAPPEAITEVKAESGMSTGAAGWSSGAAVNVVSKSGTNAYHGDLWDYIRNEKFNAKGYFNSTKPPFKQNQFGVALGGPVQIPGLVKKEAGWYVFGYWDAVRIRRPGNFSALLPTEAQRAGNFSGGLPIFDPFSTVVSAAGNSRTPFPNNTIPSSMIDPGVRQLVDGGYPAINTTSIPGRNYLNVAPARRTGDNLSTRLDHQFGSKHAVFGRWTESMQSRNNQYMEPQVQQWSQPTRNFGFTDTITLSPTFLVTARFGHLFSNVRIFTPGIPVNEALAEKIGTLAAIPAFGGGRYKPLPGQSIQGQIAAPNRWTEGPPGAFGPENNYTWSGDAHKIRGAHTIDFGLQVMHTRANNGVPPATPANSGTFSYQARQTGNFASNTGLGYASFLLGVPHGANRTFNDSGTLQIADGYSLYVQDGYRATSKLTINAGLRWDYRSPYTVKPGCSGLDYQSGKYVWDTKNPITGEAPNVQKGCFPPDKNNFAPRIGLAYQLNRNTVVRGGYGIFYNINSGWAWPDSSWPFGSVSQSITDLNLTTVTARFPNPFPAGSSPLGARDPIAGGGSCCFDLTKDGTRKPYVQQWNFSLQRQLTSTLMTELVYFGSHSINLDGQVDDNVAWPPAASPIANRQRYPLYPVGGNHLNIFPAYYNGGSIKLEKRFSQGLSFLTSYTWSKNIGYADSAQGIWETAGTTTRDGWRRMKGRTAFDVNHRWVASYVYEIPGKLNNKLAKAVVTGWVLGGVTDFDSGLPTNVFLPTDNENTGSGSWQPPNLVGNPNSLADNQRTPRRMFNTDAFVYPKEFTVGNAGRNIVKGPRYGNTDINLNKKFAFGEGKHVEFRGEFFNLFNNVNLRVWAQQLDACCLGFAGGTRKDSRQVQVALKLHF